MVFGDENKLRRNSISDFIIHPLLPRHIQEVKSPLKEIVNVCSDIKEIYLLKVITCTE